MMYSPVRQLKLFSAIFKFIRVYNNRNFSALAIKSKQINRFHIYQSTTKCCFASKSGSSTSADKLDAVLKCINDDARKSRKISRSQIDSLFSVMKESATLNTEQSTAAVKCLGNMLTEETSLERMKLVTKLEKLIAKRKINHDITYYNALLHVYLDNDHRFSAISFFKNLEFKGCLPNSDTFRHIIEYYCRCGKMKTVDRILIVMKRRKVAVNKPIYNCVILGYGRARNMQAANNVIPMMKKYRMKPSVETYTNILRAYAQCGDIQSIFKSLEDYRTQGVHLRDSDLMRVLYDLCLGGYLEGAEKLFISMPLTPELYSGASSMIPHLINKNQDAAALKIVEIVSQIPLTSNCETKRLDKVFLKQLIYATRPAEYIVAMCQTLHDNQINSHAYRDAVEMASEIASPNLTLGILRCLKSRSVAIALNDFQFIEKQKSKCRVLEILDAICYEFNLEPSLDFMRDRVITNLNLRKPEKMVRLLMTAGVPLATAISSIASHMLSKHELKEAADLVCHFNKLMEAQHFVGPLIAAVRETRDFQNYAKFLGCLWKNHAVASLWNQPTMSNNNDNNVQPNSLSPPTNILGDIALETLTAFPESERKEVLSNLLTGFLNENIQIPGSYAEQIRLVLELEPEHPICLRLNQVALEPTKLTANSASMETLVDKLEANGGLDPSLQIQLLQSYYLEEDFNKFYQFLAKLKASNFDSKTLHDSLIELYSRAGDIRMAMSAIEKARQKDPNFVIKIQSAMKIVELLIKRNEIDAAIKFLSAERRIEPVQFCSTSLLDALNGLADAGDSRNIENIITSLIENRYAKPNSVLLAPLIAVHLKNNDLPEALRIFEAVCAKYNITASVRELSCKLIQNDDWTELEKVFNLNCEISGRYNGLVNLAFSFIACGQTDRAQNIFNLKELSEKQCQINTVCTHFIKKATAEECECLLKAIENIHFINKIGLFEKLLMHYIKSESPVKAMLLYDRAIDEHVNLDDKFLIELGTFLQKNFIDVPFNIPQKRKGQGKLKPIKPTTKLLELLQTNNRQSIFECYRRLSPSSGHRALNTDLYYRLFTKFIALNAMNEAQEVLFDMLDLRLVPSLRSFRKFLGRKAWIGDIETLDNVGKLITYSLKDKIGYHTRVIAAHINRGHCEELVNKWTKQLEGANNALLVEQLNAELAPKGIYGMLFVDSSILPNLWNLAVKCASKCFLTPMQAIWCHHVTNGNIAETELIWREYLIESPTICYQPILRAVRKRADDELALRLITFLKSAKNLDGGPVNAYVVLIDLYCDKGQLDKAQATFNELVAAVDADKIRETKRLRDRLNQLSP